MSEDKIEIEFLPNGDLKVTTDEISAANHMNAEQLLQKIQELAGGKITRVRKNTGVKKGQPLGQYHKH